MPLEFGAGRLANRFFGNVVYSLLSKKFKLVARYTREEELNAMGFEFHHEPSEDLTKRDIVVELNDHNIVDYIRGEHPVDRIQFTVASDTYYQSPAVCQLFKEVFGDPATRLRIREHNPFRERYGTNRDVFVHVRLGDVANHAPSLAYFERALAAVPFEKGYIASDSPHHPLVRTLVEKYNLQFVNGMPHQIVQFANTCKYLVLSQGTFSWMMAFFAFDAERIQYPAIKHKWHGDIFVFPEWEAVEW
jgi:hypothetical protein